MQLGIILTQRVDPAALSGPARTIAHALLLAGCITRSLRFLLPVPLREGAAEGCSLCCLSLLCRCFVGLASSLSFVVSLLSVVFAQSLFLEGSC